MAMSPYQDEAIAAAKKYGVPQNMFLWQITNESGWNPNATNPKSSAKGIAQFIDGTAKQFGINPLDPLQSLDAAAKYDAMLYKQTGSWQAALEKYGTLHDASSDKIAGFKNALSYDKDSGDTTVDKDLQDTGWGGLGNAFDKLTGNLTFILVGVVVIALAILSNKQVQQVAVAAATKGK